MSHAGMSDGGMSNGGMSNGTSGGMSNGTTHGTSNGTSGGMSHSMPHGNPPPPPGCPSIGLMPQYAAVVCCAVSCTLAITEYIMILKLLHQTRARSKTAMWIGTAIALFILSAKTFLLAIDVLIVAPTMDPMEANIHQTHTFATWSIMGGFSIAAVTILGYLRLHLLCKGNKMILGIVGVFAFLVIFVNMLLDFAPLMDPLFFPNINWGEVKKMGYVYSVVVPLSFLSLISLDIVYVTVFLWTIFAGLNMSRGQIMQSLLTGGHEIAIWFYFLQLVALGFHLWNHFFAHMMYDKVILYAHYEYVLALSLRTFGELTYEKPAELVSKFSMSSRGQTTSKSANNNDASNTVRVSAEKR